MLKFSHYRTAQPGRSPNVFVCYRRLDSEPYVERLCQRLNAEFGANSVFRDTEDIGPGEVFPPRLRAAVKGSDAVLVIIGPKWLAADARARLHTPGDFVREEIDTALRAEGVRVIPVLIGGASMPAVGELPSDIQALALRNAIKLTDDPWDARTDKLVATLRDLVPPLDDPPLFERWVRAALAFLKRPVPAGVLAAATAGVLFYAGVKIFYNPPGMKECIAASVREFRLGPGRDATLEPGGAGQRVLSWSGREEVSFLLRLEDAGRSLGAVFLRYSPALDVFKAEEIIGPDCNRLHHSFSPADNERAQGAVKNGDTARLRVFGDAGGFYRLRVVAEGGSIKADFESGW